MWNRQGYGGPGGDDDWAAGLSALVARILVGFVIGFIVAVVAWAVSVCVRHKNEPMIAYAIVGLFSALAIGVLLLAVGAGFPALLFALGGITSFLGILVLVEIASESDDQEPEEETDLHSILGRWQ